MANQGHTSLETALVAVRQYQHSSQAVFGRPRRDVRHVSFANEGESIRAVTPQGPPTPLAHNLQEEVWQLAATVRDLATQVKSRLSDIEAEQVRAREASKQQAVTPGGWPKRYGGRTAATGSYRPLA